MEDVDSIEQYFEDLAKKIGKLMNENKRESILIDCIKIEMEDRKREIDGIKKKQENFGFVDHELELIKGVISQEEMLYLEKKKEEKDNVKNVIYEREMSLEDKKKELINVEADLREMHVRIEENHLKKQNLQKKIEFKNQKVGKILIDIEHENKILKELNEAVLQRVEDEEVIKKHEELLIRRDLKLKDLNRLLDKKRAMQEKMNLIQSSLEKIESDLKVAREAKERKLDEVSTLNKKREGMTVTTQNLTKELAEAQELDSEITLINYYISKAELKLMQYRRDNRDKLGKKPDKSRINTLQNELLNLPISTYSNSGKDRIDSSVKTIIDKIKYINFK